MFTTSLLFLNSMVETGSVNYMNVFYAFFKNILTSVCCWSPFVVLIVVFLFVADLGFVKCFVPQLQCFTYFSFDSLSLYSLVFIFHVLLLLRVLIVIITPFCVAVSHSLFSGILLNSSSVLSLIVLMLVWL